LGKQKAERGAENIQHPTSNIQWLRRGEAERETETTRGYPYTGNAEG
jgi:hypothetical protein